MAVQAIPTLYNGIRFRSRLEARWALFFNTVGLSTSYESEGFEDGTVRYLPDFYFDKSIRIPNDTSLNYAVYVEIKPSNKALSDREREKITTFLKGSDNYLLLIRGKPDIETKMQLLRFTEEKAWAESTNVVWAQLQSGEIQLVAVASDDRSDWPKPPDSILNAFSAAQNERFDGSATSTKAALQSEAATRKCQKCNQQFNVRESYHTLCLDCYWENKRDTKESDKQAHAPQLTQTEAKPNVSRTSQMAAFAVILCFGAIGLLFVISQLMSPSEQVTPIATAAPTSIPIIVPAPASCDCSANLYDCRDFESQPEAQACFDYCWEVDGDIHRLDQDENMIACESID